MPTENKSVFMVVKMNGKLFRNSVSARPTDESHITQPRHERETLKHYNSRLGAASSSIQTKEMCELNSSDRSAFIRRMIMELYGTKLSEA
jgi:hypothetical protein